MTTFKNAATDEFFNVDLENYVNKKTKSFYFRQGRPHQGNKAKLFLSMKGNGATGAGDLCYVGFDGIITVTPVLYDNLKHFFFL